MAPADKTPLPHVTVLLATYNGARWLDEQLMSILNQRDVEVNVVALDDESTDGTFEWLTDQAAKDSRIRVLERQGSSGSSAANFYRLIAHAANGLAAESKQLFAFADQDDVWMPDKLARHVALLRERNLDGVSSSVTSFGADGRRTLVRKDFPQRRLDYLFESPGPGCTFLVSARVIALTAERIASGGPAPKVEFHDSLVYAIARAAGWKWHIDGIPSIDYRQHDDNVMGSNVGLRPAFARLKSIREHWLRNHATLLTRVAIEVAPTEQRRELENVLELLTTPGIRARLALSKLAPKLRRRPRDQRIVRLLIAAGVW